MYENEMAQLRDVIERAAGEDATIRLHGIAKSFEKCAHEAGLEGVTFDQYAEDEGTRARLRDAARIVRECAYEMLVEKIKHWGLNLVSEIDKSVEAAECEDEKKRLRSAAREVKKYARGISEYAHGVFLQSVEYWALNLEAGGVAHSIEDDTKWCADNYGGEWNNGLTPPGGWVWALAKDEELVLMHNDSNCPLITKRDVVGNGFYEVSPQVHVTRAWCLDTYRGEWSTDLAPPKGWGWAWLRNGDLVLIYHYTGHPTIDFQAVHNNYTDAG